MRARITRMTRAKAFTLAALVAVALATGSYVWFVGRTVELQFRDLAHPQGFRELVTERQVSRFDPLGGVGQDASAARRPSVADVCQALFNDAASPAFGDEQGAVPVVAFLDYRCPYCKTLTMLLTKIRDRADVRVIYKEWPILGEASTLAARAALAAHEQGKYVAFHTRLMDARFIPTLAYIEDVAESLDLDRAELLEAMNADRITAEIQRTNDLASRFGFIGTPVVVVGRTIVQGAISLAELADLIDEEERQGSQPC